MENNAADDGVKVILPPDPIYPAFSENNVPVFLGCDDRFLPPAMTVLASVMEHAAPRNNYDLFIVQDGIPRERLALAAGWMRQFPNASLRFVDIRPLMDAGNGFSFKTTRALSRAMYFRIFAPDVFAEYDKIAYLDADIVVLGDVADFYNEDLQGNILGACHDYVTEQQSRVDPDVAAFWREQLRMNPGQPYFFSGGVVMDLAGMRANDAVRVFLEKNADIRGSNLPDQDIMNSALQGSVKFMDCAWNYLDWWYDPEERSRNFTLMSDADRETVRRARNRIKVLHFAEKKPWTRDYLGYNAGHYWQYAKKTPFYAESWAKLKKECAFWPTFKRNVLTALQQANFRMRSLFCRDQKKKRYEGRLHNLAMRKLGLRRQRQFIRKTDDGVQ